MPPPRHLAILISVQRYFYLLVLIFSILTALHAQAQPAGSISASASGIFPIALVLEAARLDVSPAEIWQPNWPVELPPDAFRLLSGEVSRITLEGEGFYLNLSHDAEGRVREFPFMLDSRMAQVSLGRQNGEIRNIAVSFPQSEEVWELEFLDYQDFSQPGDAAFDLRFPALVRASIGGAWYFITLSGWTRGITETWFDAEGNVLGVYGFSFTKIEGNQRIRSIKNLLSDDNNFILVYYYNSWGSLSRILSPGGTYSALYYRDALPRYWKHGNADGAFYFQWDANGFLVRMVPENAERAEGSARPAEYRFEYTLDEKGNWIERREIRMIRQAGLLFPSPGAVFRRSIEYR